MLGVDERMNSKIEVVSSGNTSRIEFIGIIGIGEWQRDAAKLQSDIASNELFQIFVGFEQCKNCIPIAIVTLFVSLARKENAYISVYLSSDGGDGRGMVLKLFSAMKIWNLCKQLGISLYLDSEEWVDQCVDIGDQECSPLMIFNVMDYSPEYIVEELFNNAKWGCIDSYDTDIKVKNILFETITNIKEHAYPDGKKPYAGVFVRRCKGFALEEKYECHNTVKHLYANRNKEYYQQIEHFYEIIVVDEGIGLTTSLGVKNIDGTETKYPFSESIKRTFIKGERRKASGNYKSYYSGLNLVFKLLGENADYVYGMEGEELIDLICAGNSPLNRHLLQNSSKFKGVSWMFHVSISHSSDLGYCSVSGPFNQDRKNERLLINCKRRNEIDENTFRDYYIIDDRRTFRNIDNVFYNNKDKNKEKIIWFHDTIRSKNNLLSKIEEITRGAEKDSILLIGDVEDSELPTYFCALNKFFLAYEFNCNRIVIISKNLRVQIYVKDDTRRKLFYNRKEMKRYQNCNSLDPFFSLVGYHNLVMKYDSGLLWSRILQKKKRNYLIVRGDILWESQPLSYYLNLEMILADRELYDIIKHDLSRVSGFLEGECYFKSTDVVMKKLCIDMNYYKKESESGKNIYVESVYVTGRTDKVLEMKKHDLKICVFVNYFDFPMITREVYSLFVWPKRSIIDRNIKPWKQPLCRRADTHSLTAANKISPIEYEKKQKNSKRFIRGYNDTEQDMKELYGGFVRLGHFNYHNNHDLFSFNQREIIKTSAYEYRGVFLYAFTLFMHTVGDGYYDSLKAEWKAHLVKEKFGNGIFIYRMHYYTNFLFELIDNCFSECNCDIWEFVVPLESLEKKSEQMPLLISDMVLFQLVELIKERIKDFGKCQITIFDTMNASGKTLHDMRRIVEYAVKLAKHDYLSNEEAEKKIEIEIIENVLFDCETCHYDINAPGIPAYYHFDVPRLGTKENCVLCSLIEKCIESKSLLNSAYAKKRIDNWVKAWSAVSPVYYKGVGGVGKSEVYDEAGKSCGDFSYFATQLVEIACSSSNRNYLYDFCKDNEMLTVEQKLYLLSFQIILFLPKDNYKEYNNVYTELLIQLNSVNITSNATALAAMLGSQANEKTVHIAMSTISTDKSFLSNEDIKIMFAIQCGKHKSLREMKYYETIFDLLSLSTKVDLDLLKGLHSQLYNVNGDMHSTRFDKLIKPFGEVQLLNNHCDSVYYCLEYLYTIVCSLNPLLIRSDGQIDSFHPNQQREKDEVIKAIEYGKDFLENVKKAIADCPREALTSEEKLLFETQITKPFKKFHRKLFISYGKSDSDFGKPILNDIMDIMRAASQYSYSKMKDSDPRIIHAGQEEDNNRVFFYYDIRTDKELKFFLENHKKPQQIGGEKSELWYLWNQYVVEELYYLVGDIRHSVGVVEHRTYKDSLSMFVSFVVDEEKIVITFNSMSSKSAEEIKKLVTNKHRYQREAISKLGVIIRYTSFIQESGLYLLKTEVTIPSIC